MSIYPGALTAQTEVDGEMVRYVDSLRSRGATRPCLLVHGSGGSADSHFGALFPMLASRRRVIALNYGSDQPDPDHALTIDALVDMIEAVLDATVGDEPVDLVGYSLGAALTIALAARSPHRVASLTAIGGWLRTDSQQRIRQSVWRELYDSGSTVLGAYAVLNAYGTPYLTSLSRADADALVARSSPGPDRDRQVRMCTELDVQDLAAAVTAPTLVIGCLHDQVSPIHHSWQILGTIPNARMAQIRAGHAVLTERPAEVYQLIDEFTQQPDRYPAGAHVPPIVV